MATKVICEIDVYEINGGEKNAMEEIIVLQSLNWNRKRNDFLIGSAEMVVLKIHGIEYTVSKVDLEAALNRCVGLDLAIN